MIDYVGTKNEEVEKSIIIFEKMTAKFDDDLWRGLLKGRTGSAHSFNLNIECRICFSKSLIEGTGRSRGPAKNFIRTEFLLSGSMQGELVELDLYFDIDFLNKNPFRLDGVVERNSGTVDKISGKFAISCFTDCGCGGGAGEFVLHRIVRTDINRE
jgi:hypothetical protein